MPWLRLSISLRPPSPPSGVAERAFTTQPSPDSGPPPLPWSSLLGPTSSAVSRYRIPLNPHAPHRMLPGTPPQRLDRAVSSRLRLSLHRTRPSSGVTDNFSAATRPQRDARPLPSALPLYVPHAPDRACAKRAIVASNACSLSRAPLRCPSLRPSLLGPMDLSGRPTSAPPSVRRSGCWLRCPIVPPFLRTLQQIRRRLRTSERRCIRFGQRDTHHTSPYYQAAVRGTMRAVSQLHQTHGFQSGFTSKDVHDLNSRPSDFSSQYRRTKLATVAARRAPPLGLVDRPRVDLRSLLLSVLPMDSALSPLRPPSPRALFQ